MPIGNDLPSTADALQQLFEADNNFCWLSPVSSITQRLSDAGFETPKAKDNLLITDSVNFICDDSNDSFHQFMSDNNRQQFASPTSCDASFDSDWDTLGAATQPDEESPCLPRALTFGTSPSAPLLDSGSRRRQQQQPPLPSRRILSVPASGTTTNCGLEGEDEERNRRRRRKSRCRAKRPTPHDSESLSSNTENTAMATATATATATTPKRRRLGDISNQQHHQHQQHQQLKQKPQPLSRCMSELSALDSGRLDSVKVDKAIASIDSLNLIGNSSSCHSLPTVRELNYGIRYITVDTVNRLINGELVGTTPNFTIVDCRYPYEFNGGHIKGAINIYRHEDLLERVLLPASRRCSNTNSSSSSHAKPALIFHCEFSSERAPKLARFLRQRDREMNSLNYPDLYFPEVYVLQGGYKSFYECFKCDCQPVRYTKMVDPNHKEELARFQKLGKAWERQNSRSRHCRLQETRVHLL